MDKFATGLQCTLYASRAAHAMTAAEVRLLVGQSEMLNRRRDLTGALAYTGSHFIQVLEGDGADLDRLMASLLRDRRHCGLQVLGREAINARRFGRWGMRLVESLDAADELDALLAAAPAALDAQRLQHIIDRLHAHAEGGGVDAPRTVAPGADRALRLRGL
jgi:chorismate mutase